jgi:hypothetical protein
VRKSEILFMTSLLAMAVLQFGFLQQDPSVIGLKSAPVGEVGQVAFLPEGTSAFSGTSWQRRNGCRFDESGYMGYSEREKQHFALIRENHQENIYSPGDSIIAYGPAQIIPLDEHYVALKPSKKILVLCRRNRANHLFSVTPVRASFMGNDTAETPSTTEFSNAAGTISLEKNDHGKVIGYRLQECLKYCWLLQYFNLKEGDILTNIDGVEVGLLTINQIKKIFMQGTQDIKLTVQRGGEIIDVILPGKKLVPLLDLINKEAAL